MKYSFPIIIFLSFLLFSCGNKQDKGKTDQPKPEISAPAFNSDSAFAFVKAQTDFGPRVPNSEAHEQCAAWLVAKLQTYCDTVYVQHFTATAYDGKQLKSQNIIGSFDPDKTERVLLASHWDSRPIADHDAIEANRSKAIDGADDGASGVGDKIR
jgi:hypothetical protein